MFLFPTTTSALDCFKPGGLFINTGFVYKHCVSVYRAFSVLGLLDLLVVFYVYYMILNSCLLVLYVLLVVCLFVFIFKVKVVMSRGSGGGGGGRSLGLMFQDPPPASHPLQTPTHPPPPPPSPPSPQQHQHRATDSNQEVHKPHLAANLAHWHTDTLTGLFPRIGSCGLDQDIVWLRKLWNHWYLRCFCVWETQCYVVGCL